MEGLLAQITQLPSEDSGVARFILQVVALITGGGIVQLIVFLLKRRSEINALDKTASAPLLTAANELIARLEVSEARAAMRVEALELRMRNEEETALSDLKVAQVEIQRLGRENAQLKVDLLIAQRQITQLEEQLTRP